MSANVGLEWQTGIPIETLAQRFFAGRGDHLEQPDEKMFTILMTQYEIDAIVRILAARLNRAFAGKRVAIIALLNGAFRVASDLLKYIDSFEYTISFVRVSFYGSGTSVSGTGGVNLEGLDPKHTAGRHVILLDELIDTGTSLTKVSEHLEANQATFRQTGVSLAASFSKPDSLAETARKPDFVGCTITPSLWLVGYGLDDAYVVRGWDVLTAKMVGKTAGDYWAKLPKAIRGQRSCPETVQEVFAVWRESLISYLSANAGEIEPDRYRLN